MLTLVSRHRRIEVRRISMDRDIQYVTASVEYLLNTLTVMHVHIKYGDSTMYSQ